MTDIVMNELDNDLLRLPDPVLKSIVREQMAMPLQAQMQVLMDKTPLGRSQQKSTKP